MNTTVETTTTAAASSLTVKESAVLIAIRDSEYRDGDPDLSRPVWSFYLDAAGVTSRGMGGVFASLSKKGLVVLYGDGKDSTVALTPAGIAALPTEPESYLTPLELTIMEMGGPRPAPTPKNAEARAEFRRAYRRNRYACKVLGMPTTAVG